MALEGDSQAALRVDFKPKMVKMVFWKFFRFFQIKNKLYIGQFSKNEANFKFFKLFFTKIQKFFDFFKKF